MLDGRKTNKQVDRKDNKIKTNSNQKLLFWKEIFIDKSNITIQNTPLMRKKTNFTNFVKNFSKQLKAVWTQVTDKKNYIDPPTPPPPPDPPPPQRPHFAACWAWRRSST